jgi:O-methyltransferase
MIQRLMNSLERRRRDAHHRELYSKYREFTMISPDRHKSNLEIVDRFKDVEGAVVECGVWRGGMIASIAEILGDARSYYLFDSFEGLPPAGELDGEKAKEYQKDVDAPDYYDNCAAEIGFAEVAMKMAGACDVTLVKGWFENTVGVTEIRRHRKTDSENLGESATGSLVSTPSTYIADSSSSTETRSPSDSQSIAVLRLDGDWYDSTMVCLNNLYDKVVPGGVIILDDYDYWEGCTRAVHDFLSARKLPVRVQEWMNSEVHYFVKTPVKGALR